MKNIKKQSRKKDDRTNIFVDSLVVFIVSILFYASLIYSVLGIAAFTVFLLGGTVSNAPYWEFALAVILFFPLYYLKKRVEE